MGESLKNPDSNAKNGNTTFDIPVFLTKAAIICIGVAVFIFLIRISSFTGKMSLGNVSSVSDFVALAFLYAVGGLFFSSMLCLIMVLAASIFDSKGKTRIEFVTSSRFSFTHIPFIVGYTCAVILFVLQILGLIELFKAI